MVGNESDPIYIIDAVIYKFNSRNRDKFLAKCRLQNSNSEIMNGRISLNSASSLVARTSTVKLKIISSIIYFAFYVAIKIILQ